MFCKNKTKTLLVIQTPPPFGGGEIQALNLKTYFLNKEDYYIYDYSRKRHTRKSQENYNLKSFFFGVYWIVKILILIIMLRPEKIYFTLPKSFLGFVRNSIIIIISSIFRIKVFAELPGLNFPFIDSSNSLKDKFGKRILRKIYNIRFLSESIKNNFEKIGIKNGTVIENGVYIPKNIIKKDFIKEEYIKLLFIGSITKKKGFGDILEALRILNSNNIPYHFDVVGEFVNNNEKKFFLNFINENNLINRITLHGVRVGDSKWEIFRKNHILLLPSYYEGVPLVILEALGMGLTIIASKLDGIRDIIEEGINGYLIDLGDYMRMSELIKYLFFERDLLGKIAENNIDKYLNKYRLELFLKNMEMWFNEG